MKRVIGAVAVWLALLIGSELALSLAAVLDKVCAAIMAAM